jgi:phosphomannomutase
MSTTSDPGNLAATFKAYDVRGTVPDQIDDDLARRVGNAFVAVTDAERVVVGHDMRPSSPGMSRAFAEGAAQAGADVTLIGLASTDELYFASGRFEQPGAMFTASHNPAQYNGIKMCRAFASPIGKETGLVEIRDRVADGETLVAERAGTITEQDVLAEYASYLLDLAPVRGRRRQRHGRSHRTGRAGSDRRGRHRAVLRARRHLSPP